MSFTEGRAKGRRHLEGALARAWVIRHNSDIIHSRFIFKTNGRVLEICYIYCNYC